MIRLFVSFGWQRFKLDLKYKRDRREGFIDFFVAETTKGKWVNKKVGEKEAGCEFA
jgi:hypothetical protein